MKTRNFALIVAGLGATVCGLGVFIGYTLFSSSVAESPEQSNTRQATVASASVTPAPTPTAAPEPARITASTKIIYEYYYQGDDRLETSAEDPPYFLLNLTEDKLQEQFFEWKIMEFTSARVVLRKTIPGSSAKNYILGVKDEYIAVFSTSGAGKVTLEEMTEMPIYALSTEEQKRLMEGIKVEGEDKLAKVLEDYGS
ncbi:MAG: BofC C-terminal domain-containing protein [Clostridiales bacterium]|jgi:hypothetical protein|nr:BofC C-terminal domain-containing protein [Clostridiales bacterium]